MVLDEANGSRQALVGSAMRVGGRFALAQSDDLYCHGGATLSGSGYTGGSFVFNAHDGNRTTK